MLEFKYPYILWLIPLWIAGAYYYLYRERKQGAVLFPMVSRMPRRAPAKKLYLRKIVLFTLYSCIFSFLLTALARPRAANVSTVTPEEGVDIMLVLDCSGSMLAEDFNDSSGNRLSRFDVVKNVVSGFIEKRRSDRIGVVLFAGYAYTQCPLTTDYEILHFLLDEARVGTIRQDGTAIGSAIATAVSRMKEVKARSKIAILLTDGNSNAGSISPETAALLAKQSGIKFYTIGVGSYGAVPYPVTDSFGNRRYILQQIEMDETLLKKIAADTGGRYYLATDTEQLRSIYQTIDSLEKTTREVKHYTDYNELYTGFLKIAALLLAAAVFLENSVFLKIP